VSAENNHNGPIGGAPDGAAEPSNAPESVRGGVVTSHGEREKHASFALVKVPRGRHQRLHTIDMSKVRISPDMKVQQLDPRHMPTTKMDIPPGGIRPPPPPAKAEIADPQSASQQQLAAGASPWSQNAGIDRSMLPSAAMAQPAPAQAQRIPSMPPTATKPPSSIGPGVWIAVILVAALLGGGVAIALRSGGSGSNAEPVSSSAPIAIPLGTTTTTGTDTAAEPEVVEPNGAASTEAGGTSTASPKTTAPRTGPRRTTPATKTAPAPAPAPAPTTTRPRLFN